MEILISLLVFCLVFGLIYWVFTLIPLPQPFRQIALVILVIIGVLYLIGLLTGYAPLHYGRL